MVTAAAALNSLGCLFFTLVPYLSVIRSPLHMTSAHQSFVSFDLPFVEVTPLKLEFFVSLLVVVSTGEEKK